MRESYQAGDTVLVYDTPGNRSRAESSATPAGARLLALLTHTGGTATSLRGLRDVANLVLYQEQQGFAQSVEALVAISGVQDGPGGGTSPSPQVKMNVAPSPRGS